MTFRRGICWALSGGLMGFGLLTVFSLALLPFLAGMALALYGVRRFGSRGFWMVVAAMGLVSDIVLLGSYFVGSGQPGVAYPDGSVLFPVGMLFGVIALVGLGWGLIEAVRGRAYLREP